MTDPTLLSPDWKTMADLSPQTQATQKQKNKLKKFMQTEEYENLRKLESGMDMRLDGLAFFLANTPIIKAND